LRDFGVQDPEQGAATQVWAATSPQLDGIGGVYSEDCDIAELVPADATTSGGVREYAVTADQATRLWAVGRAHRHQRLRLKTARLRAIGASPASTYRWPVTRDPHG
jgi:hypothetical protein